MGRSENCPSPARGSTWLIVSRRPADSAVRRPSGLSAGTADRFVIRTTTPSPAPTPKSSAQTPLIAVAAAPPEATGPTAAENPRPAVSSQASSVARAVRRDWPTPASSVTSSTMAGMIDRPVAPVGESPEVDRLALSSAKDARKKSSLTTALSMPPNRSTAKRRSPLWSASPTPKAPAIVAATTPQAAASASTCGHHWSVRRPASAGRERTARQGPPAPGGIGDVMIAAGRQRGCKSAQSAPRSFRRA